MKHKNYGVEAQLPPLHSSETTPDSSINQIMAHVDSRNELYQEVQMLRTMIDSLRDTANLIDKDKIDLRSIVDVMDQLCVMLSKEAEGLSDLQKQFRNQVAEMSRKSVPLSLPGNVKAELMAAYQDCLNETKRMQKEMLTDYIQALRKHTEKFQTDLSNSKGVWLSKKVFWWSAGIAYMLSLLGSCIIIWNFVH